jgi:hypothetical protein
MHPQGLLLCSHFLPLVPILSHMNKVHTLPSYSFKILSNILPSMLICFPNGLLPSGISNKTPYALLPHRCRMHHTLHPPWLDCLIISGEEYESRCSPHYAILGQNVFFAIIFLNTLSLHSAKNVTDQVSRRHKTADKIPVLYTLTSMLSKQQDRRCWTKW